MPESSRPNNKKKIRTHRRLAVKESGKPNSADKVVRSRIGPVTTSTMTPGPDGAEAGVRPLLATKLLAPALPARFLGRPRLIENLRTVYSQKRLLLFSAPAGFGKTTAVVEWMQDLQERTGEKVTWFIIDDNDNEPSGYWEYFVAALDKSLPGLKATLLPLIISRPLEIEPLLIGLINKLHESGQKITLVLDDYHRITNSLIHREMAFLLEHQPAQLQLIILSRTDPSSSLPLARLRVRNQLVDARWADLRFTQQETSSFLNSVMGLEWELEDVAALENKTEGWVAALQIAVLLQKSYTDVKVLIKNITNQRFLLDYLASEVFEGQSDQVQKFLLQTAIVEELHPRLVEALTGYENGQKLLRQFEEANLFLIEVEDRPGWYRYHYLFRQYLLERVERSLTGQLPFLNSTAAHWFNGEGMPGLAAQHALAARDYDMVAGLIERNALKLYELGEYKTLLGWLQALPEKYVFAQPNLCTHYAWTLIFLNQHEEAVLYVEAETSYLDRIEKGTEAGFLTPARIANYRGKIAALWSFIYRWRSNYREAIGFGKQALEQTPESETFWRGLITVNLGFCYAAISDNTAAEQIYSDARGIVRRSGNEYFRLLAIVYQAWYQIQRGQLQATLASHRQVLKNTGVELLPVTNLSRLGITEVFIELNEREVAASFLNDLVAQFENKREAYLFAVYLQLARLQLPGDYRKAEAYLEQTQQVLPPGEEVQPVLNDIYERTRAELMLHQGNLIELERWFKTRLASSKELSEYDREQEVLLLARYRLAQNRLEEALNLANQVLATAQKANRLGIVIKSWLVEALVRDRQNQPEEAVSLVVKTVKAAAPEGFIRTFVDLGPRVGELIQEAGPTLMEPESLRDYLGKLLDAFGIRVTAAIPAKKLPSGAENDAPSLPRVTQVLASKAAYPSRLIDPLTERELEVLRMLVKTTLNTTEIANYLTVAVSTVRTHVKNIYSKLEVQTRLEAIKRVEELNLFS